MRKIFKFSNKEKYCITWNLKLGNYEQVGMSFKFLPQQVNKTFVPQLATILHQSLMLCNVNKKPVKASFMYLFGQKIRKCFIETSYDASLIIKTKFNLRYVIAETNKRFFITLGIKRESCNSRTPKDILKDMVPILVIG